MPSEKELQKMMEAGQIERWLEPITETLRNHAKDAAGSASRLGLLAKCFRQAKWGDPSWSEAWKAVSKESRTALRAALLAALNHDGDTSFQRRLQTALVGVMAVEVPAGCWDSVAEDLEAVLSSEDLYTESAKRQLIGVLLRLVEPDENDDERNDEDGENENESEEQNDEQNDEKNDCEAIPFDSEVYKAHFLTPSFLQHVMQAMVFSEPPPMDHTSDDATLADNASLLLMVSAELMPEEITNVVWEWVQPRLQSTDAAEREAAVAVLFCLPERAGDPELLEEPIGAVIPRLVELLADDPSAHVRQTAACALSKAVVNFPHLFNPSLAEKALLAVVRGLSDVLGVACSCGWALAEIAKSSDEPFTACIGPNVVPLCHTLWQLCNRPFPDDTLDMRLTAFEALGALFPALIEKDPGSAQILANALATGIKKAWANPETPAPLKRQPFISCAIEQLLDYILSRGPLKPPISDLVIDVVIKTIQQSDPELSVFESAVSIMSAMANEHADHLLPRLPLLFSLLLPCLVPSCSAVSTVISALGDLCREAQIVEKIPKETLNSIMQKLFILCHNCQQTGDNDLQATIFGAFGDIFIACPDPNVFLSHALGLLLTAAVASPIDDEHLALHEGILTGFIGITQRLPSLAQISPPPLFSYFCRLAQAISAEPDFGSLHHLFIGLLFDMFRYPQPQLANAPIHPLQHPVLNRFIIESKSSDDSAVAELATRVIESLSPQKINA